MMRRRCRHLIGSLYGDRVHFTAPTAIFQDVDGLGIAAFHVLRNERRGDLGNQNKVVDFLTDIRLEWTPMQTIPVWQQLWPHRSRLGALFIPWEVGYRFWPSEKFYPNFLCDLSPYFTRTLNLTSDFPENANLTALKSPKNPYDATHPPDVVRATGIDLGVKCVDQAQLYPNFAPTSLKNFLLIRTFALKYFGRLMILPELSTNLGSKFSEFYPNQVSGLPWDKQGSYRPAASLGWVERSERGVAVPVRRGTPGSTSSWQTNRQGRLAANESDASDVEEGKMQLGSDWWMSADTSGLMVGTAKDRIGII
ncbi:hypothetical protein DFH06DRAFT_1147150 [Mycena polygramma]|nr:hypothetical protein DFH06DRAFT_1147150 [Mycena polygramma]